MLEVFAYKRYKKHKLTKQLREQNATEALSKHDEAFIRKSIDNNHKNPDQGKPSMSPLSRFLHRGKSPEGTALSPTPEELAAIKAKDEGIQQSVALTNTRNNNPNFPRRRPFPRIIIPQPRYRKGYVTKYKTNI
jgi:hypothetical protein